MRPSSAHSPEGGRPARHFSSASRWLPLATLLLGLGCLAFWATRGPGIPLRERLPGTDRAPGTGSSGASNAVLAGRLIMGTGRPSNLPGLWPGFRGPERTGFISGSAPLVRAWEAAGPRPVWSIEAGEGYAGPAVANGRVYLMDYDREGKRDAIRCLSLDDGREIWRYAYPISIKRNHGMSRTVPTVRDNLVVAMGPKCHVTCLDAQSGELRWGIDLVQQFGATVPAWYAGQCPLIEDGRVILAPGGESALLIAVEAASGRVLWQTPNPGHWKMTHSSIMPMEFAGEKFYVYCASLGAVGVSARDGHVLWETTDWKISIATVPSPLPLEDGKLFFSGGYDAGSLMAQLVVDAPRWQVKTLYKLDPAAFGATQHTPIDYRQHLYGVRPDGQFVCLNRAGKVLWGSGSDTTFGLGSFLIVDDLILAVNDSGTLTMLEATPEHYRRLAQAQVLKGRETWAPLALAGTRLLLRDFTRLICLELATRTASQ